MSMCGCPTFAAYLFLRLRWDIYNSSFLSIYSFVILSDRTLSIAKGKGVEGPAVAFRVLWSSRSQNRDLGHPIILG